MSTKRKPRSRNRPAQPASGSGGRAPTAPPNQRPPKQHLGTATTLLILLPVLALAGGGVWYVLGTGEDDRPAGKGAIVTADDPERKKSPGETGLAENGLSPNAPPPATPDWDQQADQQQAWATIASQEQAWDQVDNAAADGWQTEVFADRVTARFSKLKKLVRGDQPLDAEAVASILADEVQVASLLPTTYQTAFENERLRIQRGVPEEAGADPPASGARAFADALTTLLAPYVQRQQLRVKWKVFRVEKGDPLITTHQTLELSGKTRDGVREENAVWIAEWTDEKKPRMKSVRLAEYESVDLAGGPLFSDCTESILESTDSFRDQLLRGYDYWLDRRQANSSFTLLANNGLAVGDLNDDGLEDLYVCQEAGLPNLLYLQNADGTLRDHSRASGTDWLQNSSAALIVDLNNDGRQDLAVAVACGVVLAEGDGSGAFTIREILDSKDDIWSLNAVDYDRDGLLDLYAGTYVPNGLTNASANVVITQTDNEFSNGGTNVLFRNESRGDTWSFRDVTAESGLMENNRRYTFAAAWEDFDNDGDQDLYVANDFGWNNLYRNDSRPAGPVTFTDIAEAANARDDSFGMSVSWADYDRDGWMDVYISNMFSYAGNRITYQDQFKSDASENVRKRFQRYARGNTLLRNPGISGDPDHAIPEFEDHSLQAAVNRGRWAWSSLFLDVNNDGWEDLFVNNGYITSSDSGDL